MAAGKYTDILGSGIGIAVSIGGGSGSASSSTNVPPLAQLGELWESNLLNSVS